MTKLLVACAAAVMLLAGTSTRPADAQSVRRQLQAAYDRLAVAMKNKDMKGVAASAAPGFTETANGQTLNAAQAEAAMQATFRQSKAIRKVAFKIVKLQRHGDTVDATTNDAFRAVMLGGDHKAHTFSMTGVTRGTWVKTAGGWKAKRIVALSQKMLMDGKPMKPGAMAPPGNNGKGE